MLLGSNIDKFPLTIFIGLHIPLPARYSGLLASEREKEAYNSYRWRHDHGEERGTRSPC